MDISIVSGTYNRLGYLQKMVESGRASLKGVHGLEHEFVLVDGNSQDGTQEWCEGQPDVRLVRHGSLLGAVRAFNDGAFAARGDYVVMANDDVEFIGDTLLRAWCFMQANSDCGVGCFYQDRGGRDWHVEEMPCVRDGQQAHAPYGQVCIVPKWLGDRVRWWCSEDEYLEVQRRDGRVRPLHTYGGDCELSAQIYQLGFQVTPIQGCMIHDSEPNDDLRRINNITGGHDPRAVRGHHPDSWSWGRKWRDRYTNLVGPVIKDSPVYENPLPTRERVLYLPIFEPGWPVQKQQKRGLREALARRGVVWEYDYMARQGDGSEAIVADLMQACSALDPTLVLTQLHNGAVLGPANVNRLRGAAARATFVNWNGDFWPDNLVSEEGIELAKAFDLQTVVNREVLEKYQGMDVKAAYWQIGFEPDGAGHGPDENTPRHHVLFLANSYSKERQKLVRGLKKLSRVDFGLYGQGWPDGWARGENLYNFTEACKLYRAAKISIGDSQWPESGFVSNRVMQALAAGGAALAHQWFRGMEHLGLEDGVNVIVWRELGDLEEKVRHYLDHEDERRRIAEAGERLALERHSFDSRVGELFSLIGRDKEAEGEHWRW